MGKSIIRKSISRTIQAKQFEPYTISTYFEEEIEWKDEESRTKEMEKLDERLMSDFRRAYNKACKELNVDRCIGTVSAGTTKDTSGVDDFDILD